MKYTPKNFFDRAYQKINRINVPVLKQAQATLIGSIDALDTLSTVQGGSFVIQDWTSTFALMSTDKDCQDMANLFNLYGSDKSGKHNYHLAYASLLSGRRNENLSILEIGLGTNNIAFHHIWEPMVSPVPHCELLGIGHRMHGCMAQT